MFFTSYLTKLFLVDNACYHFAPCSIRWTPVDPLLAGTILSVHQRLQQLVATDLWPVSRLLPYSCARVHTLIAIPVAGSSSNEKRVGEVGGNRVVVGGFHLHDDRQILRDGSTDTCNHADSLQHGTVRRNFPDRELILVTDHSGYRALTSGLLPRLIIHHDQSSCDSGCARDNSILLLVYDVSLRLIYFSKSMYIYICIYIYVVHDTFSSMRNSWKIDDNWRCSQEEFACVISKDTLSSCRQL